MGKCELDSSGQGQGPVVVGFCEHRNEPSASIKGGEFELQGDYQLHKEDSVPTI
jgi:hypothetical protein